jgi:TonB family protein
MPAFTLGNVLTYSVQLAALAAVGVLAARLSGVHRTRMHYGYLRVLLFAGLLLPMAQPQAPADALPRFALWTSAVPGLGESGGTAPVALPQPTDGDVNPVSIAGALLIAGIGVRLVMLAVGLVALRALRRESRFVEPRMPAYGRAVGLIGATADVRCSSRVSRPVTFGLIRPVILLPPSFDQLAESEQVGVLAHELLHVKRRDWAHMLVEELVRAVLWFHPAIWWLLRQIAVAREQLVDRAVVGVTLERRAYLDALVKVARCESIGARLLAPAMLRESQLGQRVRLLLEEVAMSSKRMYSSLAVACALVCVASVAAARAFPLEPQSPPVAGTLAAPHGQTPGTQAAPKPGVTAGTQVAPKPGMMAPIAEEMKKAPAVKHRVDPTLDAATPGGLVIVDAQVGTNGRVSQAAGVGGDPALFGVAESAARDWQFGPRDQPQHILIGFNAGGAVTASTGLANALRVGGPIKPPQKIKHVAPSYPTEAKEKGVQGVVVLETAIGPDGRVRDACVLRSVPGLDQAALLSVLQWEFEPTLMNGAAVPVIMTVTINFTLG